MNYLSAASTSAYQSTDLLTARGVAHLVVHGTSGSTSYETIPPFVRLESCGGVLSTVQTWWCNDATALAGYATMTMMMNTVRMLNNNDALECETRMVPHCVLRSLALRCGATTVDFNSLADFKRTVKRADLSAFLSCNCT